ncbi:MAG: hypothetical protein BAJALOKI1v1_710014 [Promethearchaeota archaeon]|nr:MAG: hypothetical protein BAJALOKI1v1_710014 [Candidatus Lokiarchaeota archaeon]
MEATIPQIKDIADKNDEYSSEERNLKAIELLKETKILNITKLANMLIDLFGLDEGFKKVGKRAGQEIELYISALQGSITFPLVSRRENFECRAEKANDPTATIVIDVKEENVLKLLSNIIRSKANIGGLAKLVPKLLSGKVKIKGSLFAALTLVKCLMIGKNEIYKKKR